MDTSSPRSPGPSSPSHVDSIPNELLQKILLQAVRSSSDTRKILPILPLVCKLWDSQVRDLHAFKSHIVLDFKGETSNAAGSGQEKFSKLCRIVDKFFGSQPPNAIPGSLVLKTAYNTGLGDFHYGDADTLMGTCGTDGQLQPTTVSKIREADLCVDPVVALSFFIDFPAPQVRPLATWTQLTTLQLTSTWGDGMPLDIEDAVVQHGQLVTSMPQLKNLKLTAYTITLWRRFIPWGQLEVLDLRIYTAYVQDLLRVFHQCEKNLREFHLHVGYIPGNETSPSISRRARYEALKCFELVVGTCPDGDEDEDEAPGSDLDYFLKLVELPEALFVSVGCLHKTILLSDSVFRDFISDCPKLAHLGLRCIALNRSPEPQGVFREMAFKSLIEHLPRGLQSLAVVVQRAGSGAFPLEYDCISKMILGVERGINMLPLGLRVVTLFVSNSGAAHVTSAAYDIKSPERCLRFVLATVDDGAAMEEFYGDIITEKESFDMDVGE